MGNKNGNVKESGDVSKSPEESSLFSLTFNLENLGKVLNREKV
jgi:hypothetical protein